MPRDKLANLLRGVGADRLVLRLVLRAGLLSEGLAGVGCLLVEEALGLHLELVALALQDRLDELDAAGWCLRATLAVPRWQWRPR